MHLIAGASTAVGRQLVQKLIQKRLPVRVLVRKESDARYFANLGVEVIQADIRDTRAVQRAVHDVKTVVSLIGRHFSKTEAGLWEVEVEGNATLIRAAQEARVEHFILLSVLWADRDLGPVIVRAKRRAEELLIQSGLRYTILRPSMFVLGPNSLVGIVGPSIERYGLAFVPGSVGKPISFITLTDLSDALLTVALDRSTESRIYELGGREALTMAEGARRIANILHRRLILARIPRFVLRGLRVLTKRLGFGLYEMMLFSEMLADYGFSGDKLAAQTRALLGREPQSLEIALREYYAAHAKTSWADSFFGTLVLRNA